MKSLIYQFKGCYDIALSDVFLYQIKRELSLLYKGYMVIPIPSYKTEDLKREFNHVIEIFAHLNNPIERLIDKTENIKQSSLRKNQRTEIGKYLKMSNIEMVRNKKILLVDDIHTTGSTIEACLKLIKQGQPKDIKVLVIAKTRDDKQHIRNHAKSIRL
ncbi:MAG: ComF family protein [Bacilli bacterium]|nr:ComF family protein [Bacilli bacterium]